MCFTDGAGFVANTGTVQVNYQSPIVKKVYGIDPREAPVYSLAEVSRYIRVPENTLRNWVYGQPYLKRGTWVTTAPLIHPPTKGDSRLSFYNLVEAFNLSSLTRIDRIPFKNIRFAIETLQTKFDSVHPLFEKEFWTNSIDLFIKETGATYNISKGGQRVFEEIIGAYLDRVVRDDLDLSPLRVYPFSHEIKFDVFKQKPDAKKLLKDEPKTIEVDPLIAFGRPTVTGTGVPVDVIASRKRAGDTVRFIAKDYGISERQVQEAINYVRRFKKVA